MDEMREKEAHPCLGRHKGHQQRSRGWEEQHTQEGWEP